MRVKIERGYTTARVKTGLFSSKEVTTSDIRLTVEFAEEEKAIIASGLQGYLFYDAPIDPLSIAEKPERATTWAEAGFGQIKVAQLLSGPVMIHYKDMVQANLGEQALTEALHALKAAIANNRPADKPAGFKEFEL